MTESTARILTPADAGPDGKLTYRVIPFLFEGKPHYTLVEEWHTAAGEFVCESRRQITAESYATLKSAIGN